MKSTKLNIMLCAAFVLTGLISHSSISLAQVDIWTTKTGMPTARFGLSASVVNGKIYTIGGAEGDNQPAASTVEEYDPATDTWINKESMPTGRFLLSTSEVDGIIYAIGGSPYSVTGTTEADSTVEAYDPATNTWTTKTSMPTKRWYLSTSTVGGKIYAIGGGKVDPYTAYSNVEEYDPSTDSWTAKTNMPTPRWGLTTSVVNGKIYAIGGMNMSGIVSIVEEYDPATDTWTEKANMSGVRTHLNSTVVNGNIYAIGGTATTSGTSISRVEMYNPDLNTWTTMTDMPTPRWAFATSTVNKMIYAIGGVPNLTDLPFPTNEEYDPLSDSTSVVNISNTQQMHFSLYQNYPNPFRSTTTISYKQYSGSMVELNIYDLTGRKITTLVKEKQQAGEYKVEWNADYMAPGIYFCELRTDRDRNVTKMILMQ